MFKIIVSLAGIQILQAVIQIIKMKFVTVMMGAEGLGVISLINQFVQLVIQVSTLALPWVATRFMAIGFSRGSEEFSKQVRVFFKGIWYLSIFGMLGTGLFLYGYDYLLDPALQKYKLIGLISLSMVLPTSIKGFLLSVFATAGRYRFAALTTLANVCVVSFSVLMGAWLGGIPGFFLGQAIAEYVTMFYCLLRLRSDMEISPFSGSEKTLVELRKLKGSLELIVYGCVLYWLYPAAQTLVRYTLLKNGGEKFVGLYQALHGMVLYITLALSQATNLYLDPILKRDIPVTEKFAVAGKCLRTISFLMGLAMLLVGVFPELFLRTLYSAEFVVGADYLYFFLCLEFVNVLSGIYLPMLIGEGFYRSHFLLGIVVHTAVPVICVLAVPQYGFWGVIGAYSFAAVFTAILIFCRLFYKFGFFFGRREILTPLMIFGAVAVTGCWAASLENFAGYVPSLLGYRVALVVTYLVCCRLLLTRAEIDSWRSFFKNLSR